MQDVHGKLNPGKRSI